MAEKRPQLSLSGLENWKRFGRAWLHRVVSGEAQNHPTKSTVKRPKQGQRNKELCLHHGRDAVLIVFFLGEKVAVSI